MSYQPIENYGVIGDLHTVAVVGMDRSIDFFCAPGLDAASVFAALLDDERGGRFQLAPLAATVADKVRGMYTDPTRRRATDLGHVEGSPAFMYHDDFNPDHTEVEELKEPYQRGAVSNVEVKAKLTVVLNGFLDPFRERRAR